MRGGANGQAVDGQGPHLPFADEHRTPPPQGQSLVPHESFREGEDLRAIDGDATTGSRGSVHGGEGVGGHVNQDVRLRLFPD
jgi:hypothetical protein